MKDPKQLRDDLKTHLKDLQNVVTDQMKDIPFPDVQKKTREGSFIIELPEIDESIIKSNTVIFCLENRRSRRKYAAEPLSLKELSFLLRFTQGVQRVFKRSEEYSVSIRTVPSAGARHPLETYIIANNVTDLEKGAVYRYLAVEHKLVKEEYPPCSKEEIEEAVLGQTFVAEAPVVLVWAAIPYRTEWRYNGEAAKLILLDAGHVCQNLYIAAESLGMGTCGIAAYDQEKIDKLLRLDGEEELVVYLAPVGKL